MKQRVLTRTGKTLIIGVLALLAAVSMFFAGCGKDGEAKFTATVSDLYIRLGDSSFDFGKDLPEGVAVDSSRVKTDEAGAYPLIYIQGDASLEKTAFVFGVPTMSKDGGAVGESYAFTYKQANEVDFTDAKSVGITAKDSFGSEIAITAQADLFYLGEYGDYSVKYTATDLAGNKAEKTVTYTVTGAAAPAVTAPTPDVADDEITLSVALTEAEKNSLYLYADGRYIDFSQYSVSATGLVINAAAFGADLEKGNTDIELKIDTAEWYKKYTLSFTDEKPLVYNEPSFDGRFYAQAESLVLPVPQKQKPQQFDFDYTVSGVGECDVALSADGQNITLSNRNGGALALGDYTVTIKGLRNSAVVRTDEATISVLTAEDYAVTYVKTVAPLTDADTDYGMRPKNATMVTFGYDSAMNAYKVTPLKNSKDHENSIMVEAASETYTKIADGCDMFDYLAFDMYFTTPGSQNGMFFWMALENGALGVHGYWYGEVTYTKTENNERLGNYLEIEANKWYTIYIQTGGLTQQVGSGWDFFDQGICEGATENSTYYVRNIRFESEVAPVIIKNTVDDGYVYQISEKVYNLPDSLGNNCTLTGPSGAVTLGSGNSFTIGEAGSYTATGSNGSLSFTAYTAAEFAKIVAPLSSNQYDYAIKAANKDYATFTYDAEKNAYKYTPVVDDNSGNDHNSIVVNTGTDVYDKIVAGCEDYTYLAMDMYFTTESTQGAAYGMIWWMAIESGALPQHSHFYGEVSYVDAVTKIQAGDYLSVQNGKWYTVYIQTGGLKTLYTASSYQFMSQRPNNGENSPYWIKNIRFTDTVDKVS